LLTVVIPMRNAATTIGAQLEALAGQDYDGDWEVVVADNGSTDGSGQIALGFGDRLPDLRVVDASGRRGVCRARNVGAREARGDVIALCDADDVVAPGWLTAMAAAAREWDLVAGRIDDERLNDPVTKAWRGVPSTDSPVDEFLPYAVGCNCAVRASVVHAVGGWDEDYVDGGNDQEFCWRAQLAGYRLGVAPEAVVYRRFRTELMSLARQMYGRGRAQARLHRDYRHRGLPPRPWHLGLRRWLWLVRHVGHLVSSSGRRGLWIRYAAICAGRVSGSIRCRVLFL
jgi:glycosyltransferase involved in cell wall biosynthesis